MEGLIAVIVAATSATPPFLNWLSDRAQKGKRSHALADLKLRIEVVDAWIRARQLLPDSMDPEMHENAQQELRHLLIRYRQLANSDDAFGPYGQPEINWLKRAFLLYPAASREEKRTHRWFWFTLILGSLYLVGLAIPKHGADPSLEYLLSEPFKLMLELPFLLILVSLQSKATAQRQASHGAPHS